MSTLMSRLARLTPATARNGSAASGWGPRIVLLPKTAASAVMRLEARAG
jgi:hypothetical protein